MPGKKDGTLPELQIQVNIKLQPSPTGEKPPRAMAYGFTGTGHFIAKAAVNENGTATFSVPGADVARELRIIVGPETQEDQTTVSALTRRGAQEQIVRVQPGEQLPPVSFVIPHQIWPCWIRLCLVQGTLLKSVLSGGIPVDFPVCGADVQIYEVEPIEIIIARLPISAIEGFRQAVINPPPPPPPPEDGIFQLASGPTVAVSQVASPLTTRVQFAQPTATFQRMAVESSPEFSNLQFLAQHANVEEFRQALITNASLVRFIICLLYPTWVTGTLVATATTDRCGDFETWILLSCFNPNVNLYFTASVNFYGFDFQIYGPTPISCFTYWNYQCGTKVTLFTDSPFAPSCTPCPPVDAPENYVLFRAIGNVPLYSIYGTSTALVASTTSANVGLYANGGGAGIDAPFGSVSGAAITAILPRVEFDSSIRQFDKAKYYQISYRLGTSGSFQPLVGDIFRHFNHFVGANLVTEPYKLGPQTVGVTTNLFEIPPELPPVGDWAFPNPPYDLANAQFPSDQLPGPVAGGTHGLYQLKLDLFDSGGNPVNIAAAGIQYFVPTFTDSTGTIHTADASTLGLVSGNSFIMSIHIDNRPTSAALPIPTLDGNPPDPKCGLLEYTVLPGPPPGPSGTVTIQYTATQPDNFANYSYRLSRGVNPLFPPTTSGQVSAATNPATVTLGVGYLLGGCAIAGFGEDLYVAATATDGWTRLSQYDSSPPPVGFVLAPKS
jgi:hypothetical protein